VVMSTGNGSTWRQRWPELLDGLSAEQRRAVITAVAENVLEGWQPTREHIQALVDVVTGKTSTEDYIRAVHAGVSVR
jgi:Antitoxin VbhA